MLVNVLQGRTAIPGPDGQWMRVSDDAKLHVCHDKPNDSEIMINVNFHSLRVSKETDTSETLRELLPSLRNKWNEFIQEKR